MNKRVIFDTFVSRVLILVLNFGLVIYTTNIWGSSGKGIISLVIADLAIVTFLTGILGGSSISYFSSKYKKEQILTFAYLWSVIIGGLVPLLFLFSSLSGYTIYLIFLSISLSLLTTNINLFIGLKKIREFNWYTILQQAVNIFFILIIVYLFQKKSVSVYFIALILSYSCLFLISTFQIFRKYQFSKIHFSGKIFKDLFHYGWKTQLSAMVQFFNYRVSYYFLSFFVGIASVGIFSVGVAISEAIWTVSKSIALVLYSEVINSTEHDKLIQQTKVSIKVSLYISLVFIIVILLIPKDFYAFIFGKDFTQTKQIILFLSPGILIIAVSNIVGYYFAGINKLRILNIKSFIGLIFTVVFSYLLIPKMGIIGACIVMSISYTLSSLVLFWEFYKNTNFSSKDFLFSGEEVKKLTSKLLSLNRK